MDLALTYDDVALVPQFRNIASRAEPTLETWLTKDIKIGIPFIPSNMDSVIGLELGEILHRYNGASIHHRFHSYSDLNKLLEKLPSGRRYISWGSNKIDTLDYLLNKVSIPIDLLCFDIAHGHDKQLMDAIDLIKKRHNIQVIAGNVCTPMGYQDLVNAGADAVKVGIGPGSICTTRMVTGFGIPQFSAVRSCAEVAKKLQVPIIADGGIRNSRDIVLALAAGASTVMIGKLFAATHESAAEKRTSCLDERGPCNCVPGVHDGDPRFFTFAKYRGQASAQFQQDYYGEVKNGTVPEGEDMWIKVVKSADDVIKELSAGIRSGLTYGGARSIKELQRKAEFVRVTPSYYLESNTRK